MILHFRDRRGGSVTEITPNSPSLSVNRSPICYGFRAGCKAVRYSVKIGLDFWGIGSGILCVGTHLIGSINLFSSTWDILKSKHNRTKWKQKLRNPKILKRKEYSVATNTTRVSYKSPVWYHRQALTWRHYANLFPIEATVHEDIYCWVIKRSITITITKLDMEILLRDNLQVFFFKLWNNSYATGV